jgi:hypothetical protein
VCQPVFKVALYMSNVWVKSLEEGGTYGSSDEHLHQAHQICSAWDGTS